MARYIDADKLIAEYDRVHVGPAGGARKLMVEAPTADVVPRAEVEALKCEIARLEKALRNSLPSYCQVMTEKQTMEIGKAYGRQEVAREIVKDLRKSLKPYRTEYARTEPVTIENLHCSPIGVRYVIPSYELEAVIHLILEKYTEGEK